MGGSSRVLQAITDNGATPVLGGFVSPAMSVPVAHSIQPLAYHGEIPQGAHYFVPQGQNYAELQAAILSKNQSLADAIRKRQEQDMTQVQSPATYFGG